MRSPLRAMNEATQASARVPPPHDRPSRGTSAAAAPFRALKAGPGKTIVTDGSSQLVHALIEHDLVDELFLHVYPLALGRGKRVFPRHRPRSPLLPRADDPYPTGVVGLRYTRAS